MAYDVVVGIEIHVELKTKTKMFSTAPNTYHQSPNTMTSLVDLSMPGTLPLVNRQAVIYGLQIATALHMNIDKTLYFDRKNYFYPDLPKGYQITQQDHPIGSEGYLDVTLKSGAQKRIFIERAHLEEDTAKQTHLANESLEDYNRCGIPLVEIVTKPCLTNGEEAAKYVEGIREIVTYLGASDGRMDEGSLRCDTNVSLKPHGSTTLGVKCEVKNINTIQNVEAAIEYEIARQKKLLEAGQTVEQETRRFDEKLQQTVLMRKKTDAVDYKYFREPNIPPIDLDDSFIKKALASMAPLPWDYRDEFKQYGLSTYEIEELMKNKDNVLYFKQCLKEKPKDIKTLWNYLMVDIQGYLNKSLGSLTLANLPFAPAMLVKLVNAIADKLINTKQAKTVLDELVTMGKDPEVSIKEHNFEQIGDVDALTQWVDETLKVNQQSITDWQNGKDRALGYLVGQVMKVSHGKADPKKVKELILAKIGPLGKRSS